MLLVVLTVDGGGGGGGGGGIPGGGGPIHIFTGVGGGGIGQLPFNGVDVLFGCELTAAGWKIKIRKIRKQQKLVSQ